jgi:hypothetical protein
MGLRAGGCWTSWQQQPVAAQSPARPSLPLRQRWQLTHAAGVQSCGCFRKQGGPLGWCMRAGAAGAPAAVAAAGDPEVAAMQNPTAAVVVSQPAAVMTETAEQ